jgi:hypothetical protein
MSFGVRGSGFGTWGLRDCGVWSLGFGDWGFGLKVQVLGCKIWGLGGWVWVFRVVGFGIRG